MASIQIRPARITDLQQINTFMYDLHNFHHLSCPEDIKTATDIEKEKSISRYLEDPECLVFVACDTNEQLVGFVTGHFCELVSVISKPVQMGSIDEIFVSQDYRQQSVANKLIQRLEQTFEEYGVKKVFVEVWDFNKPAMNLYEKIGFKQHIHWMSKSIEEN